MAATVLGVTGLSLAGVVAVMVGYVNWLLFSAEGGGGATLDEALESIGRFFLVLLILGSAFVLLPVAFLFGALGLVLGLADHRRDRQGRTGWVCGAVAIAVAVACAVDLAILT